MTVLSRVHFSATQELQFLYVYADFSLNQPTEAAEAMDVTDLNVTEST